MDAAVCHLHCSCFRVVNHYGAPFDMTGRRVFKMSLGRAGSEDHIFDAAVEGDYVVLGWGGEID